MQNKKTKISEIKLNPNNPRLIKDDKFEKLVKLDDTLTVKRNGEDVTNEFK